jgi:hypothetical protein
VLWAAKVQKMASIDLTLRRRRSLAARISAPSFALPFVVVAGATIIGALGHFATVPNTFADEAIYIELARHFGASGKFEILGVSFPALTYGPAYVVLLAPIFRISATAREAYMMIRGLNALLFATAAIPTFLIALRAVSRRSALIVAAVAIALPAGAYTTKVMTESLAYPAVLWSVLAALRVLERPTIQRQSALLVCVVAASAVRFQLLVLVPALALACAVGGTGQLRNRCRRLMPLLVGTAGVLVGALVLLHATSRAGEGAGAHGLDFHGFSILRFGAFALSSLGAIDLYCGVAPFACTVFAVVGLRCRAPWVSSGVRAVVLLAITVGSTLLLTGSAYLASVPLVARPPTPADRYTFYVAPLLFIVFAAWIERGAVRQAGAAWIAAGVGAIPVLAAFVGVHGGPHGSVNGLGFLAWVYLNAFSVPWLAVLAAYCGLCAFLLGRRTANPSALIKPVLILVTVSSVCAYFFVLASRVYSPPPGWLDAHSRPGVVAVWAGEPGATRSHVLWEIDVANRNLSAVYFTHEPDTFGRGVETRVTEQDDGTLLDKGRPLMARYVLATIETQIVGTLVAKNKGFAIYKVRPPVRLDHSIP